MNTIYVPVHSPSLPTVHFVVMVSLRSGNNTSPARQPPPDLPKAGDGSAGNNGLIIDPLANPLAVPAAADTNGQQSVPASASQGHVGVDQDPAAGMRHGVHFQVLGMLLG